MAVSSTDEHNADRITLQPPASLAQAMLDGLPDAIVLSSVPAPGQVPTILDCNQTLCSWSGYSREELIGQSIELMVAARLGRHERADMLARLLGGETITYEALRRRKDGSTYLVENRTSLVNHAGQPAFLAIERLLVMPPPRTLASNELRLRVALQGAYMAVWDWEIGAETLHWTTEGDQIFGFQQGSLDIAVARVFARVLPEDQRLIRDVVGRAIEHGEKFCVEFRVRSADGRVGWAESRGMVLRDDGGKPERLLGTLIDITRRKRNETELQRREREFTAMVENSGDAIARIGRDHRILYLNPAAARGMALHPEYFIGKSYAEIGMPADLVVRWEQALNHVFTTARPLTIEFEMPGADRLLTLESLLMPELDSIGQVVSIFSISRDITAHKLLEQTLRRQAVHQETLAGCLQLLHTPAHADSTRRATLGRVATCLRQGLEVGAVAILQHTTGPSGNQALYLYASPEELPVADPGAQGCATLALEELPEESAGRLAMGQAVVVSAALLNPVAFLEGMEAVCLFPVLLTDGLWGCLAVACVGEAGLDDQQRRLISLVVEMMGIAIRRWLAVDALQASERRLRLALEAARLGVWELDWIDQQVIWSEQTADLFGITLADFEGTLAHVRRMVHPDDWCHIREQGDRLIESGRPGRYDLRVIHPDGTVRWIETLGQALYNEAGRAIGIVGVVMDITERRRTEEAAQALNLALERRVSERTRELELSNTLLQSEIAERWRVEHALRESQRFNERVMEATPSQVYVFDFKAERNIYVNRTFDVLLGYTPEAVVAMGPYFITHVLHPEDAARLPELYQHYQGMADSDVHEYEFRVRHADGSWRWFASRTVVFAREPDGTPAQMLGVAIDITASKKAEEDLAAIFRELTALNINLRRNSDLLRTIINSLDDGLALIDRDGSVLMVNQALMVFYQQSQGGIVNRSWKSICGVTFPLVAQTFQEVLPLSGRGQILRYDGSVATIDMQTFPLLAADGSVEQVLLHIVDITERLQFEELAIQNERLATSGRLAAIVAHEVNSPLQAIQNFLFLAASDDPAERDSYLKLIAEEIDRIGGLIRRLLDLHRPGDSTQKPLDCNALVEKVLTLTSSMLARRRVNALRELAADLPMLIGRSDHLSQVLFNLFLNALDAMPDGGTLIVRTLGRAPHSDERFPVAQLVVIEVADTGHGIPDEVLPRIFDPFYTTKPHGSGLGLAISSQIVDQHGGRLTVHNNAQGGAVFTVLLPVVEPDLN